LPAAHRGDPDSVPDPCGFCSGQSGIGNGFHLSVARQSGLYGGGWSKLSGNSDDRGGKSVVHVIKNHRSKLEYNSLKPKYCAQRYIVMMMMMVVVVVVVVMMMMIIGHFVCILAL
jgi:hypothetical protein